MHLITLKIIYVNRRLGSTTQWDYAGSQDSHPSRKVCFHLFSMTEADNLADNNIIINNCILSEPLVLIIENNML